MGADISDFSLKSQEAKLVSFLQIKELSWTVKVFDCCSSKLDMYILHLNNTLYFFWGKEDRGRSSPRCLLGRVQHPSFPAAGHE